MLIRSNPDNESPINGYDAMKRKPYHLSSSVIITFVMQMNSCPIIVQFLDYDTSSRDYKIIIEFHVGAWLLWLWVQKVIWLRTDRGQCRQNYVKKIPIKLYDVYAWIRIAGIAKSWDSDEIIKSIFHPISAGVITFPTPIQIKIKSTRLNQPIRHWSGFNCK